MAIVNRLLNECHNPYFNRWFSAIISKDNDLKFYGLSHNPYFNRWFSAMFEKMQDAVFNTGHNPYFNRWFSAMQKRIRGQDGLKTSQSLF